MGQSTIPAPEEQPTGALPNEWPRHALWTAELLELIAHAARDYARDIKPAETHRSP